MIRRIVLENWRAYRNLDLEAGPGTTFFVAPNGVGKSSLLEAVRWVLGAGHVEHRASMVRHSHREATASVSLDTARGELVVTRALRAKGSRNLAEARVQLEGRDLDVADAERLLEESWSADARFVSRTAFLTEDLRRDADEPNLRTHLCRAYSLDELQRAVAEIEPALAQVSRSVKASRAELSATEDHRRDAVAARDAAATRVAAARAEVASSRAAHAEVQAAAARARSAALRRAAAAAWRADHERLREEAAALPRVPEATVPLAEGLAALEEGLAAEVEDVRHRHAGLRARLEAAESALAALHEADASCPVCLRALDETSRDHAETLHRSTLEAARAALESLDPAALVHTLDAVRAVARRVAALGPAPEEPEPDEGPVEDLAEAEAAALATVEAAAATLREAELAEAAAGQRADAVGAELEAARTLVGQYRSEAVLEAARTALNQTITTVLGRQLAPVAAEVNRRWEAVFPDRPNLHVRPDGQMSRVIDGDALEFSAFSAGEQTVAKLMMRLTTLLATTTVPFCWVDEPLEHLDPVSRRLVASTLAHLSGAGGLEQIFVTTYEEPLARRLAELAPDRVRVQYLRTEPSR